MSGAPGWDYLPPFVVPFGWEHFVRKYRLLLHDEGKPFKVAGQMAARLALLGTLQASWAADAIVAPDWKRALMHGPIFIIGHQRSGTTLMHRLLASDRTHARALTFQEMLFPSISFQRAIERVARIDAKFGGRLARWFRRKQDALFGPMDSIHRIRFDEIEEDEFVLWTIFASAMCANDAPAAVEQRELDDLREFHEWPLERQQQALGWYRACLLKKVYREPGENVWVVGKNPAFSHKIPELLRVFPDAKFVHLVRNPLETIPSRLSLIRAIWRQRFTADIEMTPTQVAVIVKDSVRTYAAAHRDLQHLPDDVQLTVRYDDFTANVRTTIESIYARFALPGPDESLQAELDARAERGTQHHSEHHYSLEEFGLDESALRAEMADVMAAHDFA